MPQKRKAIIILIIILVIMGGLGVLVWQKKAKTTSKPTITKTTPTSTVSAVSAFTQPTASTSTAKSTQATSTLGSSDLNQDIYFDPLWGDAEEVLKKGLIPGRDADGDHLLNYQEVNIYHTDPLNPDTDGDGYPDGEEVVKGYNPLGPGKLKQ